MKINEIWTEPTLLARKMTVSIIQANPDDAEEILDLQKLAYRSEAIIYNDWTIPPLTQTIAEMRAEFESMYFLKATSGDKIIGSVRASHENSTCHIGRLIVHPEFRKKGIGTSLMERVEGAFSQAERFELFTGSRSTENMHFYQRLGYRIIREEDLSPAVRLVIMEKLHQNCQVV